MRDVLVDIDRWRSEGRSVALATVIETWGSAPRTAGGKMAVTVDHGIAGSVSGGCVESAVVGSRVKIARDVRVVGSIVGDDAEVGVGCELHNLAVVGPGASLGGRNVLDHGLRIGAGQRIPEGALRFA